MASEPNLVAGTPAKAPLNDCVIGVLATLTIKGFYMMPPAGSMVMMVSHSDEIGRC